MYFNAFPRELFLVTPPSYQRPAEYVGMVDITKNVRFKQEVIDNITLYDFYNMRDGDTIEVVSEKLYGSPEYHWVLMLLNDRYDYKKDLPLDAFAFEEYVASKYNNAAQSTLVDIITTDGNATDIEGNLVFTHSGGTTTFAARSVTVWDEDLEVNRKRFIRTDLSTLTYVDEGTYTLTWGLQPLYSPLYAYDMELVANEAKRRIKVISPQLLALVLNNFREMMA